MKPPTLRTAEHLARSAGGDGAIVLVFDGDDFAGASWGSTMPRCRDLGRRLDAIVDAMQRGELAAPAQVPRPPAQVEPPDTSEEWEEFVGEAQDLLAALDDLPERAEEFAEGVRERLEGMIEWAQEHEAVTARMQGALSNMADGVARWER